MQTRGRAARREHGESVASGYRPEDVAARETDMRTSLVWGTFVCATLLGALPPTVATAPASAQTPPVVPADGSAVPSGQFLVAPGQGVGPLRLGMRLRDVTAVLGAPQSTWTFLDGRHVYRWFQPPSNSGLGVGVDVTGTVDRIWALNDARYSTSTRLHVGSTEAQVTAALGNPTQSLFDAQLHLRKLIYEQMGLWFSIQLDQRYGFYNQVFEVGVIAPALARR